MKYVSLNGVLGIYKANAAGFLNPRNPNRTVKRPDDRRRKTFACQESFGRPHQLFYSSYYVFCRMSLIVIIHLGICNTLIDPLKDRGDGLRGFNVCEQRDVRVRDTTVGLLRDRGDGLIGFDVCQPSRKTYTTVAFILLYWGPRPVTCFLTLEVRAEWRTIRALSPRHPTVPPPEFLSVKRAPL